MQRQVSARHPLNSAIGRSVVTLGCAGFLLGACVTRPIDVPEGGAGNQTTAFFPQSLEKDVDILFVIDNSPSMKGEQELLRTQFPVLIEALRSAKLGPAGSGTCTEANPSGCAIPNVRIGVITPDMGAGTQAVGNCSPGGEGGVLRNAGVGCTGPNGNWIEYTDGNTNVPASVPGDAIDRVISAFSCVAQVGEEGCFLEHQLEASRAALDPARNVNPNFLRPNALLAVVFITDEDDCSASQPDTLFDLNNLNLGLPIDPNFRCFEYGVDCQGVPPQSEREPGTRENCAPAPTGGLLQAVVGSNSYEEFFKSLKPRGRVIMSALAGPVENLRVSLEQRSASEPQIPWIKPTCPRGEDIPYSDVTSGREDFAYPAVRLKALLDSFDPTQGDAPATFVPICEADSFRVALDTLGTRIIGALTRQCASAPPLTSNGALACSPGSLGGGFNCEAPGCLEQTDCLVEETTAASDQGQSVPRCAPEVFTNAGATDCSGSTCPCWRLVDNGTCDPSEDGTPYAFQILRPAGQEAAPGTFASVRCRAALQSWGSPELFQSLDSDADGSPDRICR